MPDVLLTIQLETLNRILVRFGLELIVTVNTRQDGIHPGTVLSLVEVGAVQCGCAECRAKREAINA